MKLAEKEIKEIANELILNCKKLNLELNNNDIDTIRKMIVKRFTNKNITKDFDFYQTVKIGKIELTFEVAHYNKRWNGSVSYYISSTAAWKTISPPILLKNIVSDLIKKENDNKDAAIAKIKKKLNKTELAQLKKYFGYSK